MSALELTLDNNETWSYAYGQNRFGDLLDCGRSIVSAKVGGLPMVVGCEGIALYIRMTNRGGANEMKLVSYEKVGDRCRIKDYRMSGQPMTETWGPVPESFWDFALPVTNNLSD